MSHPSLVATTCEAIELAQESFLQQHLEIAPLKLRWRSQYVKHFLHIIPGERILQLAAGSGLWTGELANALNYENEIVAAVFSPTLFSLAPAIPKVEFVQVDELESLASRQFDYVVGSTVAGSALSPELLRSLYRVLKPGGQIFFFEPNVENPRRRISGLIHGRSFELPASRSQTGRLCCEAGFLDIEVAPYDILPWSMRRRTALRVQAKVILLEHAPVLKELADCQYVTARKPGVRATRLVTSLAEHKSLERAVSIVIPCHNEAANIPNVTRELLAFYNPYVKEILIVNDNSSDNTAEVVNELSDRDKRIKVINRSQPNGVGRALRDGYQAASGRYILSMDCDFVSLLPELRGLFDAVAAGYEGAIGSRFSHDSVILNYPFVKMLCNRIFHLFIRMLVKPGVRDITNNLKLYRADILKSLVIRSPHFSANLETGLKPLLEGYNIREVPISWMDRTTGMGSSSFMLKQVGGDYIRTFLDIWNTYRLNRRKGRHIRKSSTSSPSEELEHVCKK
jgi:dolichol-phosphate mannosyltransferase